MRLQIILAEEMALFCARISKYTHKTVFLLANSNPRRKIGRFFCEDYCLSFSAIAHAANSYRIDGKVSSCARRVSFW